MSEANPTVATRVCKNPKCGREFVPNPQARNQVYHSIKCGIRHHALLSYYRKHPPEELERRCKDPKCGKSFKTKTRKKLYCCKRCRIRHKGHLQYLRMTPEARRILRRQKYLKDPAKFKERNDRWRKLHPEQHNARCRRWRKANPEKVKKMTSRWVKANPDKVRARNRRWDKKHRAERDAILALGLLSQAQEILKHVENA